MWKKVSLICSVCIICFILFLYVIKQSYTKENNISFIEDESSKIIQTMSSEEKVSINTEIVVENKYLGCQHVNEEVLETPDEIVNMKEEEVKDYFENKGIKLESFSNKNISLFQEISGVCDKHFVIKFGDVDDTFLSVYKKDNSGELQFYKETDIAKEYLTALDNDRLEEGIEVYGYENVETALEDYE